MIAGLAVGESAGLFHFDSRELGAGQERTGAWTVVTESNPMQVPSVASEELSASFEGDERRAVVTWWNTRTWLPGTMLLMGFGLCSVYWVLVRIGLSLYVMRCRLPTSTAIQESFRRIVERMNYRGPCRLRLSSGRLGPFAYGTLSPTILIPSTLVQEFSEEESHLVLAHELGHFKNDDHLWRPIIELVSCAFWWHPLVWWAKRELSTAGEFAADSRAVRADFSAESLASCLVKFGRQTWMRQRWAVLLQNGTGFHSALGRRVDRLLNERPIEDIGLRRGFVLTTGVMGVMAISYLGLSRLLLPELSAAQSIGNALFAGDLIASVPEALPSNQGAAPEETKGQLLEPSSNGRNTVDTERARVDLIGSTDEEPSDPEVVENRSQASIGDSGSTPAGESKNLSSEALVTRHYRVDPTNAVTAARRLLDDDQTVEMSGSDAQSLFRRLFRSAGVSVPVEFDEESEQLKPAVFFNDRRGSLLVHVPESEIDRLEHVIAVLNEVPPQVVVSVKLAEVPLDVASQLFDESKREAGDSLGSSASHVVLTESEALELTESFMGRGGVDVLSGPSITTLSGRSSKLSMTEERSVVFPAGDGSINSRDAESLVGNEKDGELVDPKPYTTQLVETGPSLRVVPWVQADGKSIDLEVEFAMREFVGYDDPGSMAVIVNGQPQEQSHTLPLPRFREREAGATVRILDGQAVVMRGIEKTNIKKTKDKVPLLGDIPLLGRLFRRESSFEERSQLLVLVSAFVVDPAGNRVNSPADSD